MTLPRTSRPIAVASALGWVWAVFMGLVTVAVTIPAASAGGAEAASMLAPAALSVASAFGAHGIRRGKWPFLALGSAAAWVAFLVLVPLKISLPGIGLNLAIVGLVVTHLRQFR